MSDAATIQPDSSSLSPALPSPRLHPAPGRCIVRIVPRILSPTLPGTEITAELDGRYENQPMVGILEDIGDPTSERESAIRDWAIREGKAGHLFVFSTYGSGSPYWDDHMRKMKPLGYDFTWLQGFRLFDIRNLNTTIEGAGMYGERKAAERSGLILLEN